MEDLNSRTTSRVRPQAEEGNLTKSVENVTAKIPSLGYMGIALASLALSVGIASFSERKWLANFVGHWVPTFLLIGLYNKIVKVQGSDQTLH